MFVDHTSKHPVQNTSGEINALKPKQNGRHYADDTFKRIFLNENVLISIKISLKFSPKDPVNNIPALVQIMAWRLPGDKPYLNHWWLDYLGIYTSLGLRELMSWAVQTALMWYQFLVDSCDVFNHIIQGSFSGIEATIWLLKYVWNNPEGYGLNISRPRKPCCTCLPPGQLQALENLFTDYGEIYPLNSCLSTGPWDLNRHIPSLAVI